MFEHAGGQAIGRQADWFDAAESASEQEVLAQQSSLLADIAKVPEKQSAAALAIRRLRDMNISMDALYSATQATAALKSERRNVQTNAANLDTRAENLAYVLRKIVETERAHKGLPAPVSLNLESNLRAPRLTPF